MNTTPRTIDEAQQGDIIEFVEVRRGRPRLIRGRVGTRHGNGTTILDCECVSDTNAIASRYTLLDGHAISLVEVSA